MSPTFSVNSPSQLHASNNIGAGTSVDSTTQNSGRFSLSSFSLESGSSINLTPLFEEGSTIHEICQSILDCIGND